MVTNKSDWDRIAEDQYNMTESFDNRSILQLLDILWASLGNVKNKNILDIGCGYGWLTNALFEKGANPIGIDFSEASLSIARLKYPSVHFINYDLENGLPEFVNEFDLMVANMSLMNVSNIDKLILDIGKSLQDRGKIAVSITHPCFFNYEPGIDEKTGIAFRKVSNYLIDSIWRISSLGGHNHYHRSLTFYFDIFIKNHLLITKFYEPKNTPQSKFRKIDTPEIPVYLFFEATKVIL